MAHIGEEGAFRFVRLAGLLRRLNGQQLCGFAPGNILQRPDHPLCLLLHIEGDDLPGEQHPAPALRWVLDTKFTFKNRHMLVLRGDHRLLQGSAIVLVDQIEHKTQRIAPLCPRLTDHRQQGVIHLQVVVGDLPVPDTDLDRLRSE